MKLEARVLEMLQQIGVRSGQTVLDFGSGKSTIPVAKIVGEQGRISALGKEALDELTRRAKSAGLKNIRRMKTSGKLGVDLADESVDVVLLIDVFHSFYFLRADDRKNCWARFTRT